MQFRVAVHVHVFWILSLPRPPTYFGVEEFSISHKHTHTQLCMLSRKCEINM